MCGMSSENGPGTGYRQALEAAGYTRLHRGLVSASGPDHVTFLHSMVTNEVANLAEGAVSRAALLTPRGKMVCDFFLMRLPDRILLELDAQYTATFLSAIGQYIIMDEVEFSDRTDQLAHLRVMGPQAAEFWTTFAESTLPEMDRVVELDDGWGTRRSMWGLDGFDLFLPAAGIGAAEVNLRQSGLQELQDRDSTILRVEAGEPAFGVDVDESNYLLEAGLDSLVSYTKGCYVGQEVVSKATYIGGVARKLCCLLLPGPCQPGDSLHGPGDRVVGRLSSVVDSPRLGQTIGLALVKTSFAEPGTRLDLGSEDSTGSAEVVENFLGAA